MPLLRPSDLARTWNLHVRTVLAYVERGELSGFRTPGGHVRLRADAVRAFAEARGLPVPLAASGPRPDLEIVAALPAATDRALRKALDGTFRVRPAAPPVAALLRAASSPPLVVLLDAAEGRVLDAVAAAAALGGEPATRDVAVLAFGARSARRREELEAAGVRLALGPTDGRGLGVAAVEWLARLRAEGGA